ncbi:MAG: beta-N-acetylhexosaminidase [Alphaproteobacteria bacterium]
MSNNSQAHGYAIGAKDTISCIFSLSGTELTDREASLFKESNPFGFILFKRNCESPSQLKSLIDSIKSTVGRDCPILIDQEGGRVQRLRSPYWREYKPMKNFGDLYNNDPEKALEDLRFETLRLADELVDIGVNVNCAPVLDLIFDGAHDIIGDRSFSSNPDVVGRLGLSVCRHFLSAGITPIIKHIPGHGRATGDSHLELPYVGASYDDLSSLDFSPFREVSQSEIGRSVWAMTAHIVYEHIDSKHPVSVSDRAIADVIRKDIGFDGILIGDDLDMKALDSYGDAPTKALKSLDAGCDLALYCAGEFDDMNLLSEHLPKISDDTVTRLNNAHVTSDVAV